MKAKADTVITAHTAKYQSEPRVVMAMSALSPLTKLPALCQQDECEAVECKFLPLVDKALFLRSNTIAAVMRAIDFRQVRKDG
jgi:hypothetical protein